MNKNHAQVQSQGRTHSEKEMGSVSISLLHPADSTWPKIESQKHPRVQIGIYIMSLKPCRVTFLTRWWSLRPEATETDIKTAKVKKKIRWKLCFLQNELASWLPFLLVLATAFSHAAGIYCLMFEMKRWILRCKDWAVSRAGSAEVNTHCAVVMAWPSFHPEVSLKFVCKPSDPFTVPPGQQDGARSSVLHRYEMSMSQNTRSQLFLGLGWRP